ncbi:MAG: leucine-rich repeat domain-containing protein, partial [Bacteroidia bacterium]
FSYTNIMTVKERIAYARKTAATVLDLGNCGLTEVPDLSGLPCLAALNLGTWYYEYNASTADWGYKKTQNIGKQNRIADLTGIEVLSDSLESLSFSSNQVSDISPLEKLTALTYLYFSYNQVSDISPLEKLTALTQLDFSRNQVSDISPLEKLTALTNLYFSNNQVSDISPLEKLTALTNLDFSENQVSDISPLEKLTALTVLNFYLNQVSDISPLEKLTALTILDFSLNQVSDISPLEKLTALTQLYFSSNQVSDISPLEQLTALTRLYFSSNQVSDISPLEKLNALTNLYFSSNQVSDISPLEKLIQAGLAVKWSSYSWKDDGIYLEANPLTHPPVEVVKQGNAAVLAWFAEVEEEVYFQEARVLLLGEGGHGKTSLLTKLKDASFPLPKDHEQTRAIDVCEWKTIESSAGREIAVKVWDFGGQDIYQATHPFFFSENVVYVLVHDTRGGESNYLHNPQFTYWLETAKLYGGGDEAGKSHLLIFQNERNDTHKEMNLKEIVGQFPATYPRKFAVNLAKLNATHQPSDWSAFQKVLKECIEQLPHLQQPSSRRWLQVKEKLEELAKAGKPYISYEDYLNDICAPLDMDEDNAKLCSLVLHSLGVCLHFQDKEELHEMLILEKSWATKAVYKFFDDKTVKQTQQGKMTKADRDRLWAETQYKHHKPKLLSLMQRFELCYPLNEEDYLIPQLLPANPPTYEAPAVYRLRLQYHYHFLPKDIISRIIVRLYKLIAKNKEGEAIQWASGVMLHEKGSFALINNLYIERVIDIQVSGDSAKDLLQIILYQIDDLHDSYKNRSGKTGLQVEKMIPCTCKCKGQKLWSYEELTVAVQERISQLFCHKGRTYIAPLQLLEGTFKSPLVQDLYRAVAKGNIKSVLAKLIEMQPSEKDFKLLLAQITAVEEEKIKGILPYEKYSLEKTRITDALLTMIQGLEEGDKVEWTF